MWLSYVIFCILMIWYHDTTKNGAEIGQWWKVMIRFSNWYNVSVILRIRTIIAMYQHNMVILYIILVLHQNLTLSLMVMDFMLFLLSAMFLLSVVICITSWAFSGRQLGITSNKILYNPILLHTTWSVYLLVTCCHRKEDIALCLLFQNTLLVLCFFSSFFIHKTQYVLLKVLMNCMWTLSPEGVV